MDVQLFSVNAGGLVSISGVSSGDLGDEFEFEINYDGGWFPTYYKQVIFSGLPSGVGREIKMEILEDTKHLLKRDNDSEILTEYQGSGYYYRKNLFQGLKSGDMTNYGIIVLPGVNVAVDEYGIPGFMIFGQTLINEILRVKFTDQSRYYGRSGNTVESVTVGLHPSGFAKRGVYRSSNKNKKRWY